MLRIVFFGSGGEGTMVPLRALAARHEIVAVVKPAKTSWLRRTVKNVATRLELREPDALMQWGRTNDVTVMNAASGRDPNLIDALGKLAPDVICVSAFPWLLCDEVLQSATRAALNIHPSLLPRHRGPVPLFWIYHSDDRQTGVTVHHMNDRADSGKIVAQQAFDLERGFPVDLLHAANAACGTELLVHALQQLDDGCLVATPQDDAAATYAPRVKEGVPMIDFQRWDVERVWHFLAGLCPRYTEPLRDELGRLVRYRAVLGYERSEYGVTAGVCRRASHGWDLYCTGGIVKLGDESMTHSGGAR